LTRSAMREEFTRGPWLATEDRVTVRLSAPESQDEIALPK
jgi:hypothetical protein